MKNNGILTADEIIYKKAEKKYVLVKQIEKLIKEHAIDCPLTFNKNIYSEKEKYASCVAPFDPKRKKSDIVCPVECDFTSCNFRCANPLLNKNYWNQSKTTYDDIPQSQIDRSTFNYSHIESHVQEIRNVIETMFMRNNIYTLDEIIEFVKKYYDKDTINYFDEFYVYQTLDDMIINNRNDRIKIKNVIVNNTSQEGYLIYRNNYYIFKEFEKLEFVNNFDVG